MTQLLIVDVKVIKKCYRSEHLRIVKPRSLAFNIIFSLSLC